MREVGVRSLSTVAGVALVGCLLGVPRSGAEEPSLLEAAAAGQLDAVRARLDDGASVETVDARGRTPLMLAASAGHLLVVEALLEAGAAPGESDLDGGTALVAAVRGGHDEVAMALLDAAEPRPDEVRRALRAALPDLPRPLVDRLYARLADPGALEAVIAGDRETLQALPDAAIAAETPDDGSSLLGVAAWQGDFEMVAALLARGADAAHPDLVLRAAGSGRVDLVRALRDAGAPVERALTRAAVHEDPGPLDTLLASAPFEPAQLEQALAAATRAGRQAVVSRLLEAGAATGAALHVAVTLEDPGFTAALLRAGADPNHPGRRDAPPLMRAVLAGRRDTARLLLEAGADPNRRDAEGRSPLVLAFAEEDHPGYGAWLYAEAGGRADLVAAAAAGDLAGVRARLARGADPDGGGSRLLPLSAAAYFGHEAVAVELLEAGARIDPDGDPEESFAPLLVAAAGGRVRLVERLLDAARARGVAPARLHAEAAALVAAEGGHHDVIRILLDGPADPDRRFDDNRTLVAEAAGGGDLELLDLVLEAGADPDRRGREERTPLHEAAARNAHQVVGRLVDAGADLEARDARGATPLMHAARAGAEKAVAALLAAGADPGGRDSRGRSAAVYAAEGRRPSLARSLLARLDPPPLADAARVGDPDAIRAAIAAGADPDARDAEGRSALDRAASAGHAETVAALAEAGADLEARDDSGLTALVRAASAGHAETVAALVEAGADLEARDEAGLTALARAARAGAVEGVRALIRAGARVEARDEDRTTPLHHAAAMGRLAAVEALLDAGAGADTAIDEGRRAGWTPLMAACFGGHLPVVQRLLEAGADLRARNRQAVTPLVAATHEDARLARWLYRRLEEPTLADAVVVGDLEGVRERLEAGGDLDGHPMPLLLGAVAADQLEVTRELIDRGADVEAHQGQGWTPLMAAAGLGRTRHLVMLLEAGADVGTRDDRGWTALMAAANRGHLEAVERLLAAGADPSVRSREGETALDLARKRGHEDVAERLGPLTGAAPVP